MRMQTRCWETTRCRVRLQGASPTDHADRAILLRISVIEDARKSYIPLGIDVGIDFLQNAASLFRASGLFASASSWW